MLNCICHVIKPQHECVYRTCVRVCNNGFMLHTLHGKFHIWHNGAFFCAIAYISPIGRYGLPFIEAQLLPYRWPNKCRGSLLGKFVPIYCHCPILIMMILFGTRRSSMTSSGLIGLSFGHPATFPFVQSAMLLATNSISSISWWPTFYVNVLSSWGTGKNDIALNSILNTIDAAFEGRSEFALVVLMAPKWDVSMQVQVCEVCYLPTAVCPALALNLFFFAAAVCRASALVIVLSRIGW